MKAHELAKLLLAGPNLVVYTMNWDGPIEEVCPVLDPPEEHIVFIGNGGPRTDEKPGAIPTKAILL